MNKTVNVSMRKRLSKKLYNRERGGERGGGGGRERGGGGERERERERERAREPESQRATNNITLCVKDAQQTQSNNDNQRQ